MTEGLFITFEGGEGSGKTTLIEAIEKALRAKSLSVLKTREPGGTKLGEKIRTILLEPAECPLSPYAELCLFLASRAQHIEEVIRPALEKKWIVLCDRFNDSTIAYQGAGRALGMREVASVCQFITHGLTPHLTFYLDIAPKEGLARAKHRAPGIDRIESEKMAFHDRVHNAYLLLQGQNKKRLHLLDATQSKEEVFHQAMRQLEPLLQKSYVS